MNNSKKICSILAFVVLAGISCWATEHSFHLLIKWMPEVFVWGLTIAFFIIASYGSKLIVDSFNQDLYIEHRRRNFWVGTVLVLVFWLFMSMPTNTHTFFYNHKIGNVVQEDLTTTNNYLSQIKDRVNIDSIYYNVHNSVNSKFDDLSAEFNAMGRSGKHGNGQYVRQILRNINAELEKELPGTAVKFNDAAWNSPDQLILSSYENQMNKSLERIKDTNYKVASSEAAIAREDIRKIGLMTDTIKNMVELGDIHEDVITQADGVISSGYSCVKDNHKYVKFNNKDDEELYTADNLETRTKRMLSVIDVWLDFFAGKYPISFFFYILLSILVDIAAFMFFNFAFPKED
jgi:hypothetical protein